MEATLELIDRDRAEKVSDRHQTDEGTSFGHPEMERTMLVHEVRRFRQRPPLLDAWYRAAHDIFDRNEVRGFLRPDELLDDI